MYNYYCVSFFQLMLQKKDENINKYQQLLEKSRKVRLVFNLS